MPDGALHRCRYPGCGQLLRTGERCALHSAPWGAWRGLSTTQRGLGGDWQRKRKEILERDHYACQPCVREGRYTYATQVDHRIPRAQGGARLDEKNLESICDRHHIAKSARERAHG